MARAKTVDAICTSQQIMHISIRHKADVVLCVLCGCVSCVYGVGGWLCVLRGRVGVHHVFNDVLTHATRSCCNSHIATNYAHIDQGQGGLWIVCVVCCVWLYASCVLCVVCVPCIVWLRVLCGCVVVYCMCFDATAQTQNR